MKPETVENEMNLTMMLSEIYGVIRGYIGEFARVSIKINVRIGEGKVVSIRIEGVSDLEIKFKHE